MANNRGGQTIAGQPAVHLGNFDEMLRLVSGPGSGFDADTIHGLDPTDFARSTTTITAGIGLSGGGALDANRSLAILFAGTGAANTSARSDHNHTLASSAITDVTVTTAANGEILRYNGTVWINNTLAEAGIQPAGSYLLASANAVSATKLLTARSITLTGDVTGTVTFDGTANVSIAAVVADDSHNHTTANIDGLDTALAGKSATTHTHTLASAAITDVTVTTAANGEILRYNGTVWINNTLAEAGIQPAGSYLLASANAVSATKLATARTISLTGDVTGSVSFDGTGNAAIAATYKASGVGAGTYRSVTVDAKGNVTAGTNPTTVASYGLTDVSPTTKVVATIPATLGWYRIATSPVGVDRCAGRFEVDWAASGNHGQVNLQAGIMYSTDPTLNQIMFSSFNIAVGITRARIVYHTTYAGNYAYLEVYNASAASISLTTQLASSIGWSLITPIAGSIPAGYVANELIFSDGIVTDTQLVSTIATGISPLKVTSTTPVANLAIGGNAGTATKLLTARTISLTGDVTGSVAFDGSGNVAIAAVVADSSHVHSTATVTGLDTALAARALTTHTHTLASAAITDVTVTTAANGEILRYNGTVWINNTLAEAGIQPAGSYLTTSGTAANSTLLDSLDSTAFMRSNVDAVYSGKLTGSTRQAGLYGTYDSAKIDHIWSMGTAYLIEAAGANFGGLYGMAYKHTNNLTGGTMAGGHQIVFTSAGTPGAAIGLAGNIWTSGTIYEAGATLASRYLGISANAASASKWATGRTITLTGDVVGTSAAWDGAGNISFATAIADDSHNHTIANVDLLQATLDGKSLSTHTHTLASASITDVTVTSAVSGEILRYNGTSWINNTLAEAGIQPAGSYLTTSGTAANSTLLDSIDSTQFLRSDVADTGTSLTLNTSLITDTINGRTASYIINLGNVSIDGNGTTARWRNTNQTYISQEITGDVSMMGTDAGVSATKFRFLSDSASPYHRAISFGNTRIKALNGTLDQVQIRNSADTANIELVALKFTAASTRETKKNIEPYVSDALNEIDSTNLYTYNFNHESDTEFKHIGIIYDESPVDVVSISGVGIDTYSMSTMAWKAIQQLSAKEQAQQVKIEELSAKEQTQAEIISKLESQMQLILERLESLESA